MTVVWLNGALLARDEARISPADRGFTLGDGLFETMRAVGGRVLHLPRHMARLKRSLGEIRIAMPMGEAALNAVMIWCADHELSVAAVTAVRLHYKLEPHP